MGKKDKFLINNFERVSSNSDIQLRILLIIIIARKRWGILGILFSIYRVHTHFFFDS